jgi:hypothetical protein
VPGGEEWAVVLSRGGCYDKTCRGKDQKGGHAFSDHVVHGAPSLFRRKEFLPQKEASGRVSDYNSKNLSGNFCPKKLTLTSGKFILEIGI